MNYSGSFTGDLNDREMISVACSCFAGILCLLTPAGYPQLLSRTLIYAAASAKVDIRSGPGARREDRYGLLLVDRTYSAEQEAVGDPALESRAGPVHAVPRTGDIRAVDGRRAELPLGGSQREFAIGARLTEIDPEETFGLPIWLRRSGHWATHCESGPRPRGHDPPVKSRRKSRSSGRVVGRPIQSEQTCIDRTPQTVRLRECQRVSAYVRIASRPKAQAIWP